MHWVSFFDVKIQAADSLNKLKYRDFFDEDVSLTYFSGLGIVKGLLAAQAHSHLAIAKLQAL